MRNRIPAGLAAATMLFCSSAIALERDFPTYAVLSKAAETSNVVIACSPKASPGRALIHCTFAATAIHPVKEVAEIEDDIAALERDARSKGPAEALKNLCKGATTTQEIDRLAAEQEHEPEGPEKAFNKAVLAACRGRNVSLVIQTFEKFAREVQAHSCSLTQTAWQSDFERVDADTWIANSGPEGACHISHVETLRREPGDGLLWNYRLVSTEPAPAKEDKLCGAVESTRTEDYSWKNRRTREHACRYLEL